MSSRYLDLLTSADRKQHPIVSGVLDYFPDAIARLAFHSWVGNEKHNPGQPLHWSRDKSSDHADCIARHLEERGGEEEVVFSDGRVFTLYHTEALAWRALALAQEEAESRYNLDLPRGAR